MKLLYVLSAILAATLAEDFDDLVAAETVELMKEDADLRTAASSYNYIPPSQRPSQWNQQNYVPQNTWYPPQPQKPIQATNTYVPPPSPIIPPQNDYVNHNQQYYPPQPTYAPTWSTPPYHTSTTTTPVPVIKNEMYYGDNGSYKYEYQIADGTHVGEEGYFTDPKRSEESLVKKGWYSFTGADGKVYTVTYWADKTGFHAYGDHLPTPPPVPPAIQVALDEAAKEEEAEKHKPIQAYPQPIYPTQGPVYQTTRPPVYQTTQPPVYYPPQPTYYPPQPTYYPQEPNYSSYGKK